MAQFVFVFNLVTYSPLKFGDYEYPGWGQAIGWLMTVSSLIFIPAVMIYKLLKTTGTIKEVNTCSNLHENRFENVSA